MELLTILYAMLAALTGFSVGEAAPVRQPSLVASAEARAADIAVAAVHLVAATPSSYAQHQGRLLARQGMLMGATSRLPAFAGQVAWIDLGRRHL